jgi:hypothetical protein
MTLGENNMQKNSARFFVCLAAFSVGVSLTFLLSGRTRAWFIPSADRSCQVKHVGYDGSVVWTPCG